MSTGLTFGSISALFGFNYGYIDQAQYSILVTVVIASAVIPTVIAQIFFQPREVGLEKGDGVGVLTARPSTFCIFRRRTPAPEPRQAWEVDDVQENLVGL